MIKNIPEEKVNDSLERLINTLYSVLATNEASKLTFEELTILKGLLVSTYKNKALKTIYKAFVWCIANERDLDFKIFRVDFKTISNCLAAFEENERLKKPSGQKLLAVAPPSKEDLKKINAEFIKSILAEIKDGKHPRHTYAYYLYKDLKDKINYPIEDSKKLFEIEKTRFYKEINNVITPKKKATKFYSLDNKKTFKKQIQERCMSIVVCEYLKNNELW